MKRTIATIALALLMCCSAFARNKPAEVRHADVKFDKFKNITNITTDTVTANAGHVMLGNSMDAHNLIRQVDMIAAISCAGQVTHCVPIAVEFLLVGQTVNWCMRAKSISLLIDGQSESVPATWDGQVLSGSDLREYISANPTAELLVKLANAKTVDVQIGQFEFSLNDASRVALIDLLTHVDASK